MRTYTSLFRIRFINGLQYRTAALAGLATQFVWGFMEILAFGAFYRANPGAFPMEFSHLVSYIWLQQAFLALFMTWGGSTNAVESIVTGQIAYDLSRPVDLYNRWFAETVGDRVARCALRCAPVLLIASLLPEPFNLTLPPNPEQFILFVLAAPLATLAVVAFSMLDQISTFYTMSRYNALFVITADFFVGGYIPLPFFPDALRRVIEWTPFYAMQNMPLRIYSGNIAGAEALRGIVMQIFWLAVMLCAGKLLMRRALRRVVAQGG
jgi:ABC-2 type transport system permease protein